MSFLDGLNHGRKPVQRNLRPVSSVLADKAKKLQPEAYNNAQRTYKGVTSSYKKKGKGYVAGRILSSASGSLFRR